MIGRCFANIHPKDPFVCPKNPGLPRSIPILFGWDWSPKHPALNREASGSLGIDDFGRIPPKWW